VKFAGRYAKVDNDQYLKVLIAIWLGGLKCSEEKAKTGIGC
jgi:hypothetical protein